MAYGLNTRMHLEDETRVRSVQSPARSSAAAHAIAWAKLPATERLAIIEREIRKAA